MAVSLGTAAVIESTGQH
ncbi:rCG59448 [Rattus norvegicus]|uniref:RCG59448 n=1 Tax=Rattus norvegicus TaxID=10116 RepID=A6HT53_RAT|nr:rCG59448 [Rattus norvegicus]